jgi:hypothetical protein
MIVHNFHKRQKEVASMIDLDCYLQRICASVAPTIIFVCHSGTCTFSGDHCGFSLLKGYNLVLRARATFLMYPCGSGMFACVCNLVGLIFLV